MKLRSLWKSRQVGGTEEWPKKNQGLLDEARLEASYQRALRVLQDTVVAVPDELEAEEDLGPVQDEDAAEIVNEELFFEVEVNQEENNEESDSESEEVAEAEEEPNVLLAQVEVNKRIRVSNTMIGEIRKGKYSK